MRLDIVNSSKAEQTLLDLYKDIERRAAGGPVGQCPVDMMLGFLKLSHAQTCGKCVPCRVGLNTLANLLEDILSGKACPSTVNKIKEVAKVIKDSADCAIGRQAAEMVLRGTNAFEDDMLSHITNGVCLCESDYKLPCVSRCPANVDIPGYIALTAQGRYADAIKLIRKDNPYPTVCAYVCEHPC